MNQEFMEALEELEQEKGIDKQTLLDAIKTALISAYKRNFGITQDARVEIDENTGAIAVFAEKEVVEEVFDPSFEVSLDEARKINEAYEVGDTIEEEVTRLPLGGLRRRPPSRWWCSAFREAERGVIYEQYIDKENEIMTGIVVRQERGCCYLDLGKVEGLLPLKETIPGERYDIGTRLKVYVIEVKDSAKGAQIVVSRSHPGLLKRLWSWKFRKLLPIQSSSRASPERPATEAKWQSIAKIRMWIVSAPASAPRGSRIERVVEELSGERIDVISWHNEPAEFIASALRPAKVIMARVIEEERAAQVIVPDYQLSLAIGKEGQNARLAAKLTGYKIDIKCQSQLAGDVFGEGEGLFDLPPDGRVL